MSADGHRLHGGVRQRSPAQRSRRAIQHARNGSARYARCRYERAAPGRRNTLDVLRRPERPGQYRLSLVGEWAGKTGAGP